MGRQVFTFGNLPRIAAGDVTGASGGLSAQSRDYATTPLVGYIRNAKSHRNKGNPARTDHLPNVVLAEPRTRSELEEALADFRRRGISLLAISGGDGTIRDVLTRGAPLFGDDWPAIMILPQGKTNALALDLGISRQWNLPAALDAARQGKMVARRPLRVEQTEGDQRTRFGFFLGAGVFNAAIDAGQVAHRYGAFQGFAVGMTAAFGIMQTMFGFGKSPWRRLSRMRIRDCDSGALVPHSRVGAEDFRFIAGITTLRTFPPRVRPFSKMESAGPIGYFLLDAPLRRAAALAPLAAVGWQSPLLPRLGVHRGSGNTFLLELDDPLILDGERFPAGRYRISTGPDLRFVVP